VRLGGAGVLVAGAAVAPLAPARHELDPDLRRRQCATNIPMKGGVVLIER